MQKDFSICCDWPFIFTLKCASVFISPPDNTIPQSVRKSKWHSFTGYEGLIVLITKLQPRRETLQDKSLYINLN